MNWYIVKLVYRIICGNGEHTAQFDEQLRLLQAECKEEAIDKAIHVGRKEEETFYNDAQQLVQWKFIAISEIYPLENFIDGAEICSQIKETNDADAYCTFVQHKAQALCRDEQLFIH